MNAAKLNALLARKPEMVNEFPAWLVSPETLEPRAAGEGVVIAEIAGRDSAAAVLEAVRQRPIQTILPTIAYTATEFGDWAVPLRKCEDLRRRLSAEGITVRPPVFLGSPRFWWLLCGRPASIHTARYGLPTTCLGCHLYVHALRIPLAKRVGADTVISGERENHDNRIKLNQIADALDAYVGFLADYDVELRLPVRHVREGAGILAILGEEWKEGRGQLQCVLSKNDQDENGRVTYDSDSVKRFFSEFALPVAQKVVDTYLSGQTLGDAPLV